MTPDIIGLLDKEWVFTAPEEIGRASIRRFAQAIGDANPLYHDATHAGESKYEGIIAPPTMVCETLQYMAGGLNEAGGNDQRPVLPLDGEIRGGNEYTLFKPLRPEDILTVRWRAADVTEKEGRSGKLVFLVSQIVYTNQHSTTLAVNRETTIYRVSESATEEGETPIARTWESAGAQARRAGRRDGPLHFEDVEPGDELTALEKAISLPQMVSYAAATWDFHRYHYDHEYARQQGYPQPFADGQMLGAFLAQMLADWMGDPGAIHKMGFRFRDLVFPGDVLSCKGRVTAKSSQRDRNLVECELWIENQDGELVLSPAHASILLPSRGI